MRELEVLNKCLDEAGPVLLRHFGHLERVEQKSDIDFVTIADRESEAAIIRTIKAHFPSHQILAEESGAEHAGTSNEFRWIIDPLDGTTNYSHSFPLFSISIALEKNGEIVVAGVENPFYRERFVAEKGGGASLNGQPLRVSSATQLSQCLAVTGFPYDRRERIDHYLGHVATFLNRAHGVLRLGSAALDLASVAAGRLDLFWEEKLNAWDTAAGFLLVEEAGGRVTNFSGEQYTPFAPAILATNGAVHEECLTILRVPQS